MRGITIHDSDSRNKRNNNYIIGNKLQIEYSYFSEPKTCGYNLHFLFKRSFPRGLAGVQKRQRVFISKKKKPKSTRILIAIPCSLGAVAWLLLWSSHDFLLSSVIALCIISFYVHASNFLCKSKLYKDREDNVKQTLAGSGLKIKKGKGWGGGGTVFIPLSSLSSPTLFRLLERKPWVFLGCQSWVWCDFSHPQNHGQFFLSAPTKKPPSLAKTSCSARCIYDRPWSPSIPINPIAPS